MSEQAPARKVIPISEEQCPEHLRTNRSRLTRWFGRTLYRAIGWNLEGNIVNSERVLIVAAPHTSNWDFVFGIFAILGINARLRWLGKHTIFKPGVTWFMRWLGGIPVNREKPDAVMGYVEEAVEKDKGVIIVVADRRGPAKNLQNGKPASCALPKRTTAKFSWGRWIFPTSELSSVMCLSPPATTKLISNQ